jgi:hypothetical protein
MAARTASGRCASRSTSRLSASSRRSWRGAPAAIAKARPSAIRASKNSMSGSVAGHSGGLASGTHAVYPGVLTRIRAYLGQEGGVVQATASMATTPDDERDSASAERSIADGAPDFAKAAVRVSAQELPIALPSRRAFEARAHELGVRGSPAGELGGGRLGATSKSANSATG